VSRRVALVASTTAEEGGALLAARLRHLREAGWDARLFCKGESLARSRALHDSALQAHIELAPGARGRSSPFDRRLRRLRPELVHFHSGWAAWKARRTASRLDCAVVVGFREDGQDLAVPDPPQLWGMADLLLFPSVAALERAAAAGWPEDRAAVLHAAVAPEGGAGPPPRPGALNVLSAGPLGWEQGFEHSIHGVRLALERGVPCRYRILGDGDHLTAVAFARHQLGLDGHVELVPPDGTARLAAELESADVFVDPAVTDTTSPTALRAALARGVPFVATVRATGPPADAGITVPRRDPQAIAEALERLAADPELRVRLGAAGRSSSDRDLQRHLEELEALYQRVLG
jgi:glycosyltransferase involved in cell wall biosynthesis